MSQVFQSSQLPGPSQLGSLQHPFARGNTLAPIASPDHHHHHPRYPPSSYLPSSSTSSQQQQQQQQWPPHRTSSSRDDRYPPPDDHDHEEKPAPAPPLASASAPARVREQQPAPAPKDSPAEESMPPTSDFVKKLYKMLEDQSFQHVVSWGPHGDCFVVKDMNEFTKSILPRMFKHSNFASFVRQLNKYDFHKVKNTDDNTFGEHSWTFRHPDFHADRRDALENIKRKVPAARKPSASGAGSGSGSGARNAGRTSPSPSMSTTNTVEALQAQVERLRTAHDEMAAHVRRLEAKYDGVVSTLVAFQQDMAKQDGITRLLIQSYLQGAAAGGGAGGGGGGAGNNGPQAPAQQQQQLQQDPQSARLSARQYVLSDDRPFASDPGTAQYAPNASTNAYGTDASANAYASDAATNAFASSDAATNAFASAATTDVYDVSESPFLPRSQTRRLVADADVARASLFQMNEMSRRAELAGLSLGFGDAGAGAGPQQSSSSSSSQAQQGSQSSAQGQGMQQGTQAQQQDPPARPPSSASRLFAAAAQLMAPLPDPTPSTLARIEELAASRAPLDAPFLMPQGAGGGADGGAGGGLAGMGAGAGGSGLGGAGGGLDGLGAGSGLGGGAGNNGLSDLGASTGLTGGLSSLGALDPLSYGPGVHEGLQIFTLGHLLPRSGVDDANGTWTFDAGALDVSASLQMQPHAQQQQQATTTTTTQQQPARPSSATLRVRRSAYVPGWAVPPRVLLVEDDAVSRRLSSKFLQVFGCTTDVAVDGEIAVNMMNVAKYDLVLMDIVMPKLDGVSATSLIRQFDADTPIISMTANSKPDEIMTYFSHGMNDILPKPFTKHGLLEMLTRHLGAFRAIQEAGHLPRALGPAATIEEADGDETVQPSMGVGALVQQAQQQQQQEDDEGKIDPLVAMGLTGSKYGMILSAMTGFGAGLGSGAGGKRALEDGEEREGKRGRFEVVE